MNLQQQLQAFSDTVRFFDADGDHSFNKDKLSVYQSLVFANLSEVISPCFPILKSIMGEEKWRELILSFFQASQLLTPIYHELPFELLNYLQETPLREHPFAGDLAHYEWLELELDLADTFDDFIKPLEDLDLLSVAWRLSDCARLVAYQYDVHNISVDYRPSIEQPSFYILSKQDSGIQFTVLAAPSFQLLQCLLEGKSSPRQIMEELCLLFIDFELEPMLKQSHELIQKLYRSGIILPLHPQGT